MNSEISQEENSWLTIKLTKNESIGLTRLRASLEMIHGNRLTIKEILNQLIKEAIEKESEGRLDVPMHCILPSLESGFVHEQIAYPLPKSVAKKLKLIVLEKNLDYSATEFVRTLIMLESQRYVKMIRVDYNACLKT